MITVCPKYTVIDNVAVANTRKIIKMPLRRELMVIYIFKYIFFYQIEQKVQNRNRSTTCYIFSELVFIFEEDGF